MFLKYYSHISGGAQDLPQPLCPAVSVRHGTDGDSLIILLSKVDFNFCKKNSFEGGVIAQFS